ncbi:MAG TPA: ankyrin repeat domain-containing protein [Gaiellaceae bacterium]|nr:ankyrin repeat domain-containing protein [Gaiellaceae bacterium]
MDEQSVAERIVRLAGERGERALELLEGSRDARDDPWVALSLGDPSRVADAAAPGGPLERPPLFYVARSRIAEDTVPAARDLLARGADPNGPGVEGEWTNLSVACARGDVALARVLLDAGADPNDEDALYHSTEVADAACTELLLERGARVNGTNALGHALDYERLERVRLLLEHGADPNEDPEWTALYHAVFRGRSAAFLELLVAYGADVDARSRAGRTAYQEAYRRGREDLCELLRALGSPTDVDDADVALHAIATGGDVRREALGDDAADVLIELAMRDLDTLSRVVDTAGAMFEARWGGGPRGTLLHQAAWLGRPRFVELLLARGAEVDARVETQFATPLGWAAVGSRYTPDHPDDTFSSPDADYVAVAQLLVAAGARVEPSFVEMAASPLADWLAEQAPRRG